MITVKGVYKEGKVKLLEVPEGVQEASVLVTFLSEAKKKTPHRYIVFGQFSGPGMSTEEDFRMAEWHGEIEI